MPRSGCSTTTAAATPEKTSAGTSARSGSPAFSVLRASWWASSSTSATFSSSEGCSIVTPRGIQRRAPLIGGRKSANTASASVAPYAP